MRPTIAPVEPPNPSKQPEVPATLDEIVENKRREVAEAKAKTAQSELEMMVAQEEPPRNFFRAVTRRRSVGGWGANTPAVIAEVRRRGNDGRLLRAEFEGDEYRPGDIARRYHVGLGAGSQGKGKDGGGGRAAAVSCVTEGRYWGGDLSHIRQVKDAVPLPVLRNDVIIDPWQLWESRAAGADAVVLLGHYLREGELVDMLILAQQLQLTALLSVHDVDGLLRVRPHVGFPHRSYGLLGINNQDPVTWKEDLGTALRLADLVEDRTTLVSVNGVVDKDDLLKLRGVGVRIVLVGEHLIGRDELDLGLGALLGEE